MGDHIYIIGCLGHYGTHQPEVTRVYGLDCQSFEIEKVETHGDNPGWIYRHQAEYKQVEHVIKISKGEVFLRWEGKRKTRKNRKTFWLDLETGHWSSAKKPSNA